jgi:hypothetical protein
MNHYLLMDHWTTLVRDLKDDEKQQGRTGYEVESLARRILDYVRTGRFRQYKLFTQQRGEEFEKMYETMKSFADEELLKRYLASESLWQTTLELAES